MQTINFRNFFSVRNSELEAKTKNNYEIPW
nr:MAG TPA: hypothetical protein [Caudoviricetes sp.]